MPYNLMLLPIVGGYYILSNFDYLQFKYNRLSSQRVLFASIVSGTFLVIFIFVIRALLDSLFPSVIPYISQELDKMPVVRINYLWTSILSFLIAVFGTYIMNFILKKCKYFGQITPGVWAVNNYGNELEQLFMGAAIDGHLMQITLKNNKVYIGFANDIPKPSVTNYLIINPILSGYRDSETKEMDIKTNYLDAVVEYAKENYTKNGLNYDIILKQDEILSATRFHPRLQAMFEKKQNVGAEEKKED